MSARRFGALIPFLSLSAVGQRADRYDRSVDSPIGHRIRAVAATAILVLLVSAVAGTMVSLLIPDFDRDISRVLISGPPLQSVTAGANFIEDGGPASVLDDFNVGIRLGLLGLLVIGIPLGVCARLLTTSRLSSHVDDQWTTVLHVGFVLQLLSIALAVGLLLLYAMDGLDKYKALPIFTLLLVGDLVIGGIALPLWRSLEAKRGGLLCLANASFNRTRR